MNRHMSFEAHVNEISKKLWIYVNRISFYLDKKSGTIVVESLVLRHINFCLSIWDTTISSLINKVQKLQNFAKKCKNILMTCVVPWLRSSITCILIGSSHSWLPMTVLQVSLGSRISLLSSLKNWHWCQGGALTVPGPKAWNITSTASHASFKSKQRNYISSDFNCF